ncbi:glycoside hydrolase/phage tail family protein [Asticcacaulis sp. AND118]|uniref:baseplate multidomain protein megatron n=1 Tax=Asticcacaulis sp. AND118 TaxID=2840468 RepID=UPI001CFFE6B9|nr:glycoside hydrolase/phage tail family protein [Asticcacaulis sp. AND118]UDF03222.1 glycoside hydrolase/phage tail family protein [Asticcacaulis sp. AND118]
MAQLTLMGLGTALGGPIGGAIGGLLGNAVERTLVSTFSPVRQVGPRLEGVRITAADQGAPIKQVYGRGRVAGTVLWAARLRENRSTTRASKTAPGTENFSYSLSFAVGLCEGPIDGIGRIWADGQLLDQTGLSYRLYRGEETQMPDELIVAIEGDAPAYRGLAYLVFEDLPLAAFGNRPPNLSVEVFHRPQGDGLETLIDGVCLIPGAGEFVYATTHNAVLEGLSGARWETLNNADGQPDFLVSLDQLEAHLPKVKRVNLAISWFGDGLDAGACRIRPGVEQAVKRTRPEVWSVAGIGRDEAHLISTQDGRPVYGGTPSDASVIAAIRVLKQRGYEVTLVPFILMDCAGFPWRGRIASTHDLTAQAADDVAAFFGAAEGWGLRRFVRHLAALAVEAGGVDAVLLGSELRGVTTTRSDALTYPAVAQLKALAAEVRAVVGPDTKLSYAADWSEYFGHHTGDHAVFHLDPLWADADIDFVGIDWYAPLTDWREGDHTDAEEAESIYDPAYLASRVRGGEGFDWYYASSEDKDGQVRSSIADGAFGEYWMFRPKDIQGWWANPHHDRPGGIRQSAPTDWVPQSKPIRFVEYGCGAIDKGPNAPNLFVDPKSSESAVPPYSTGARDDRAQRSYLTALSRFYADPANNPVSTVYGAPMLSGMNVWCWDARPYPDFPRRAEIWGDGGNWRTGHWLNGRVGSADAKNLLSAIAAQVGSEIDVSEVEGVIDGYVIEQPMSAASAMEPVLSYLGLDLAEANDGLKIIGAQTAIALSRDALADHEREPVLARRELIEAPSALTLRCYDLDRDYQVQAVHARSDMAGGSLMQVDLGLSLSAAQARDFVGRTLNEARGVREAVTLDLSPADVLRFETGDEVLFEALRYRVVEIDLAERPCLTLTPVSERTAVIPYEPSGGGGVTKAILTGFYLLDLPGFGTDETNARPVLAATAVPFTGVDVYAGAGASALTLRGPVTRPASVGYTRMGLPSGQSNKLNRPACLDIYLEGLVLQSRSEADVLEGANFICVMGTGGEWEIIQYHSAELTGLRQWRLSGLIRGQWGTRALQIVEGASVIHLSEVVRADMPDAERGLPRLWRAGLSGFGGTADGAIDLETAWAGVGLRPRAPVHGRMRRQCDMWRLSWIRCAVPATAAIIWTMSRRLRTDMKPIVCAFIRVRNCVVKWM